MPNSIRVRACALFVISAFAFVLAPALVHAAWETNGNNVTQPVLKRFDHFPHVASDGQEGAFAAWDTEDDLGPYDKDVAVCRMSFEGDVLWSHIVSSQAGYQRGSEIVDDGAEGAIVVWFDERSTAPGLGIYAQRYNDAGVAQWTMDGIRIADSEPILSQPDLRIHMVSDGAGGAYVVWNAFGAAFNGDVFAQRVMADGSLPWGTSGLGVTATTSDYQYSCDAVADGSGGLLVVWAQSAVGQDIYAQHFDAMGGRLWGSNGAVVIHDLGDRYTPRITSTSTGGAIVIWDEESTPTTEIYAQRLEGVGTVQWAPLGVSISTPGVYATEGSARLVSDGADGALVVFTDNRNDPSASDLFSVHLLATGATGPQHPLAVSPSRVTDAALVSDGVGGAFVSWHYRETIGVPLIADDIYCQWLDADGNGLLTIGGALLCDMNFEQMYPQVVLASPGRFIVAWEDNRDYPYFTDCFAQLVEGNTAEGPDVTVSPVDLTTGTAPATITFDNVTSQGATSLTTAPTGPPVPGAFQSTGVYYHITTNATFSGSIEVCVTYDPLLLTGAETDASLIHYDGSMWVDITTSVDTLANVVCGTTTSLSPFVIGTGEVTSGIGQQPSGFALHQNVPNPFNPITSIRYDVPLGGADVSLAIYDAAGRLVRELVNEHRGAGTWSVQWNGDDAHGGHVASGVYFYRMRAGSFVDTKKMVLLK